MKFFKCFVVLMSVYFCMLSCLSPEEKQARRQAKIEARERAAAVEREYNRILDSAAIDEITTCKHGSLDKVKKNLLLMGFEIETSDNQFITTKYKNYSNRGTSKWYTMVNAVKLSPSVIKFKVREKYEYVDQEQDKQVVTVNDTSYEQRLEKQRQACRKDSNSDECNTRVVRKDKTSETVSYRDVTRTQEYDPTYYARNLEEYKSFKDQVCGPEPVKKVNKDTTKKAQKK